MLTRPVPELPRVEMHPLRVRAACATGAPMVFRGLVGHWDLVGETLDRILAAWPERTIRTHGISVDGLTVEKVNLTPERVRHYLSPDVEAIRHKGDGLVLDVPDDVPELLPWMPPPAVHEGPIGHRMFMGHDTITDTHYHLSRHNLICQVLGRKRVLLCAPIDTSHLYPSPILAGPQFNTSRVDLSAPDLRRFPKLLKARPLETVLEPGDALFLPVDWWHAVYGIGAVLSVSLSWEAKLREHRFSLPSIRNLLGLARWQILPAAAARLNLGSLRPSVQGTKTEGRERSKC